MRKKNIWTLITAMLIPVAVGVFSAFLTGSDMNIYENMNHPFLAPPGWVFPIAWTVLYIVMGIASYLVYTSDADSETRRRALTFYAIQLAMNFFWSTLFFTYSRLMIAFIWIVVMWILTMICMIKFLKINTAAGLMMGVLLLWTTFAAYLNLASYIMSITPMPLTS